jgi:hypothetical protein
MRYVHPPRLTKKAVQIAEDTLLALGFEAKRVGGFEADEVGWLGNVHQCVGHDCPA